MSAAPAIPGKQSALEHASQIRDLPPTEAAIGLPVHLTGVVTYYDPAGPDLFIQDATAGIYVDCDAPVAVERGQQVEITGVSGAGDFAPVVVHPRIRVLGPGKLPKPIQLSFDQLLAGRGDSQWLAGDGVIKSAVLGKRRLELYVASGGGQVRLIVLKYPKLDLQRLIEARVRFRGAAGATFNNKRQLTGLLVFIQSFDDIAVDQLVDSHTETNAALYPLRRADQLLRFSRLRTLDAA